MIRVSPQKMNLAQQKVYNYIVERISDKSYSVGDRIPTEMELADLLGINRMNVHKALTLLQGHGLLFRNKSRGTTVAKMPSTFTIGELKRKTGRFVAVLNPLPKETVHIHWNRQIISSLNKKLRESGLELKEVDVSGINSITPMSEKLKELAHDGAVALLCISSSHLSKLLEENPNVFFSFHRDIFVYARDIVHWSSFPYNVVSVDLFNEGVMVAEYTFAKGYDQFFFGTKDSVKKRDWISARLQGVQCGLSRMSDSAIFLNEVNVDITMENEELLSAISNGQKVMIIAAADVIAVQFIEKIKSATGKLPGQDYGVISFNDDSRFKRYKLTTIAPPLQDIGLTLGTLITDAVSRKNNHTSFIKVKSQLKQGETS